MALRVVIVLRGDRYNIHSDWELMVFGEGQTQLRPGYRKGQSRASYPRGIAG